MVTSEQIKNLREQTGVSIMACKAALEETGGDFEKAIFLLVKRGVQVAEAKAARVTKAGVIDAYIHPTKQIGVLLELRSETDFVAKTPEFQNLAHDISMHIAACCPEDAEELLRQPFVKKPETTAGDYVKEFIQKFGENIEVSRFIRFNI